MGFLSKLFRRGAPQDDESPFMEHPCGKYRDAVHAMESALSRLRSMRKCDRWLTFCAQGQGARADSYHFAELKLLGDRIDPGDAVLDSDAALRATGLDRTGVSVSRSPEGHMVVSEFSPQQLAVFLDALFRDQMGVRPHDGEGDDYAVGAEW